MYRTIVTTSFFLIGVCQKAYVQGARHSLEPEGAAGDGAQRAWRPPRRVFRGELWRRTPGGSLARQRDAEERAGQDPLSSRGLLSGLSRSDEFYELLFWWKLARGKRKDLANGMVLSGVYRSEV